MNVPILAFPPKPMEQVRLLDSRNRCDGVRVMLRSDGPGILEVPHVDAPCISIHVGKPVRMDCRHGVQNHSGMAIHGDIDIIPNGTSSRWEMKEADTALVLRVEPRLLRRIAEESGFTRDVEIRSRFRVRDPQIEYIGWALMAEAQNGYPSGRLYMDCMATALAVQLLRNHSSVACINLPPNGGMTRHKLRQVQAYIEENLRGKLSLHELAEAMGMSASHLKVTFRKATGMPVHQYVIHRRVERAAMLLKQGKLPINQIALEVGFAHQSHLAMHLKRLLGVSPREVFQMSRGSECDEGTL